MKKLIIATLVIGTAATMYAQGTVRMVSKNAVYYGPYLCAYLGIPEGSKVGSELYASLMYEGQVIATQPFAMSSKGEPTGKLKGDIVTTPLPAGTVVPGLTIRADSYDYGPPIWRNGSAPFSYTTGDPADPTKVTDPWLDFESFVVDCPEPTTIALGILGLGSLFIFRRRN